MAIDDARGIIKKSAENAATKTKKFGEKTAGLATGAAQTVAEKASDGVQKLRENYYNPLTLDEFMSNEFNMPNLVIIMDNSVRENVDLMADAIGWTRSLGGVSVLHLYEKAVVPSGIQFFPQAECYSCYYIDKFGERYINLESYFDIMQDEKRAELFDIAYSLGAKNCTIETYEYSKKVKAGKVGVSEHIKAEKSSDTPKISCDETGGLSVDAMKLVERKAVATQTFKGSITPRKPRLKWYANNAEMLQLIKARCDIKSDNRISEYHRVIDNKSNSSMSIQAARNIDSVLGKLGVESNVDISGELKTEQRQLFKIDIEFAE